MAGSECTRTDGEIRPVSVIKKLVRRTLVYELLPWQ